MKRIGKLFIIFWKLNIINRFFSFSEIHPDSRSSQIGRKETQLQLWPLEFIAGWKIKKWLIDLYI